IVGRKLSSQDIIRGLRVDGVGTMIGGTFNSFPHTSFSQNVGLVSVTRVHSRWVCISSGIILILFGMVPKMAVLVASIPQFVLGGAVGADRSSDCMGHSVAGACLEEPAVLT
ncbi:solute carrier family 23 protein, partial [Pseudomonas aeruginosa]|uniref:solute carrier family 23 protein n=1 Tax=Pseudomonas aeruginosa TaxID=287 RepID=UPI0031B69B6F